MSHRSSLLRTRWSAMGVAVAITLGAGGLLTASAAEPAGSVFIPISPTRVLDTRIAAGLPGPLMNSTPALLDVTGTIPIVNPDQTIGSAVVVPDGATSIVANVTGVTPSTIGYVAIRPGDTTGTPSTSSINFTAPGVIVPNSVTVAIPTAGTNAGHLNLFFFGITPEANIHLLIDIVGYFSPGGSGGTPGPEGPQGPAGPVGPAGQPHTGHSRNILDAFGNAGYDTSIAIGTDGNPIISYHESTFGDLRLIACNNPSCAGPQAPVTLDNAGNTGSYTSSTIGTNGNPIISYHDATNTALKVVACNNPTCAGPQAPITVDNAGNTGYDTSITIGTNGNPIISYHDGTNTALKVIACTNPGCTGVQTPITLDVAGSTGYDTSITIGIDGNPIISYHDLTNGNLRVVACTSADCTGPQAAQTLDEPGVVGLYTSITIGIDGNPVISYHDTTNTALKAVVCTNPTCAGPQAPVTVDNTGNTGYFTSITIAGNGNPIITYHDIDDGDLDVIACTNPGCAGPQTPVTVDDLGPTGFAGYYTSIVIGPDGNPVISYQELTALDLKVLACGNPTCQNYAGNGR
jgi:hypothetical protein